MRGGGGGGDMGLGGRGLDGDPNGWSDDAPAPNGSSLPPNPSLLAKFNGAGVCPHGAWTAAAGGCGGPLAKSNPTERGE